MARLSDRAASARGRQLRRRLPALLLAVVLATLGVFAVRHEGVPAARVDLNDGGIWVTNQSLQLVGNLNHASRSFQGTLRVDASTFDVQQFRDVVTLADGGRGVAPVDVAGVRLGAATPLPDRARVVQGGTRLGVLDPVDGNLWVADAANPATFVPLDSNAVAADLEGGVLTAAADGTVLALGAKAGGFVAVDGRTDQVTRTPVAGLDPASKVAITAVGARPVGLDQGSNELILPSGVRVALSDRGVGSGGVLQQPGPDAAHVLLATPDALVRVALVDGTVEIVPAQTGGTIAGRPAAPARLEGCAYAAWSLSGNYLRACDGDAQPLRQQVETLRAASDVRFRTNRDLIVLNDVVSGSVWLPDQDMVLAADWDPVDSQLRRDDRTDESPQTSEDVADPERSATNTPPIATDDAFGIRPGRSVTLDVLANDSDADGNVLTARPLTAPGFGTVWRSRGGQALRLDVGPEASGKTTFSYEASDGLALDAADVTVSVVPFETNTAPKPLRDPGVKVGSRAEVEFNVLPHWRDPESDRFFLKGVSVPAGLGVQFREEGTITIRDVGHAAGSVPLTLSVADQFGAVGQGTLTVRVLPPGNLPPSANADFHVGRVNEPVLLNPLANDTDPNNDTLALVGASAVPPGTTLLPDLDVGTMTFTASAPGSYSFTYTVTDGPAQRVGIIRVDVVAADDQAVPVAEDDIVLLPRGGGALVEPLSNDTDPSGGVLVLQSVTLPPGLDLKVTLVDHHLLRLSSRTPLAQPVSFTYTVANGERTAEGRVFVVPSSATDEDRPPELQPDRARVRAGDIGSANVLANDRSPAGLALKVDPVLQYTANPDVGTPFVTGNQVRLEAGSKPGFLHVAYTVRDAAGHWNTSTVSFEVVAAETANAAPRPRPLTAWAVSGQSVRIPVPTTGIDPDGDSVVLAGIETPPAKGTATLGVDWLEYTPARDQRGTDVFTYLVEDRLGKQATARVRVGIAPPASVNQPPTVVSDTLLVRPGRTLTVPVLENDLDPNGDKLSVLSDGLEASDPRLAPRTTGAAVTVTTPDQPGSYVVSYRVTDGRGGIDTGSVTLNVLADAPLLAPQARDDVVASADLPPTGPVEVDVLANDADPDGDAAQLTLSTRASGVTTTGRRLQITPADARRLVVYTLTDADGLTGSAIVAVPGRVQQRPKVNDQAVPVELRAGQEVALDLRELVLTRNGRTPRVADPASVAAPVGADGPVVLRDAHTLVFRARTDYVGPATVSVLVGDGSPEDRSTLTASLTFPLVVLPAVNHPPTVTPSTVHVEAGEAPTPVDLRLFVKDPDQVDPGTFRYQVLRTPSGVNVTANGSQLTVGAPVDHAKGPAGSIGIGVDDGSGVVAAEIPVVVTSSLKPLVQVSDAVFNATNRGALQRVDITQHTINPFPGVPLRITGTQLVAGDATVNPRGTVVEITPQQVGQVTVAYTIMDATNDPDRVVEGRIRLVVRDVPAAPSGVAALPTGPGSALVTFTPGTDNGAPITSFTLTHVATGRTWTCNGSAASCTVTGLANGDRHAFTVTAHNAVGPSPASGASEPVLVDVSPAQPNPPTGTVGDRSVTVTWVPPTNEGSALTGYTLFLTGDLTREVQVPGTATSFTFDRLTNGVAYRIAVQATNRADKPSAPSAPSAPLVPFGPPPPPTSVSAANLAPDDASAAKIEVSWAYPGDPNGRPWDAARVTWPGGVREVASNGSVTATTLLVAPGESVDVSVALHTEGGWSDAVTRTVPAASVPVAIDPPTVTATGADGTVTIAGAFTKAGNGYRNSQLSLEYSDGTTWRPLGTKDLTLTGLTNGRSLTFSFRQVAQGTSFPAIGPPTATPPVTPWGPPIVPTLKATADADSVAFAWTYVPTNGGPQVTKLTITVNGTPTTFTATSGTHTVTGTPGQRLTAVATACDALGACTSSAPLVAAPWGTVTVAPSSCSSNPTAVDPPLPGDQPPSSCATFTVKPSANWLGNPALTCTFVSDVDDRARTFTVRDYAKATASGLRTLVTDQTTMTGWLGTTLTCRPS